MSLWSGLEKIVKFDEPMSEHTWFRLGGPARYFIRPHNRTELMEVVKRCHENDVPMYVLGRGSNVLIVDEGLDGAVVQLLDQYFGEVTIEENIVRAGAGAGLSKLVQKCARQGLSGMECMAGIPGSVGGAVKINAGGQFGDIGNVAQSVQVMDSSGYEFVRHRQDIYFGYRMTNIIAKFILEAEFSLVPEDPERIGRLIKEVWMLKKNSQPTNSRNAGCVFKNPRAMAAGALIDKVDLKGYSVGGAYVSEKHANFIEGREGATSTDVLQLINVIKERVQHRFGVELDLEIDVWK